MKRLLLFMLLGCSLSMYAVEDEVKTVTIYKGAKASNNCNNPCKGATIRECARIETTGYAVSDKSTLVTSVLKNVDDKILSQESYYVEAPVKQVMEEYAKEQKKKSNTEVRFIP